jgi:hypothetical protein
LAEGILIDDGIQLNMGRLTGENGMITTEHACRIQVSTDASPPLKPSRDRA